MVETSPQPAPETEVREYLAVWAENTGQVLTQVAGVPFTLESVLAPPPEIPVPEEHDLQIIVAAAGSLRGEMSLRVPRITVLALGQLFLQNPGRRPRNSSPTIAMLLKNCFARWQARWPQL
jgi:hypothetical protein